MQDTYEMDSQEEKETIDVNQQIEVIEEVKISEDICPLNYKIHFSPNYNSSIFSCTETIEIEVFNETPQVVVNGVNLSILSARYEDQEGVQVDYSSASIFDNQGIVQICFDKPLSAGKGKLHLDFEGIISEDFKGFYRFGIQPVPDETGSEADTKFNYATQFEPCFARRAFFCWDEPHIKSTFDISLMVPKKRVGLSNMKIIEVLQAENDSTCLILKFDRTPLISSYLITFIIAELDFVEEITSDGVICRVYTPVEKRNLGFFALHVAVKSLSFFSDYFDLKFPLDKLDLVPLQVSTSMSMENWGLITMRDKYLLVEESECSAISMKWSALILAHEISHQWLGNLVTIQLEDLWFKEAFGTFAEYLCINKCFPKFDIWSHFAINICNQALTMDALESSHPICGTRADNITEVVNQFDTISYLKGASLLRMMHSFLSDAIFCKGARTYLSQNSFKTSTSLSFWKSLEEGCEGIVEVKRIMRSWTKQKGFPLVKVVEWSQQENGRTLIITQEKFCAAPHLNEDKSDFKDYKWCIPLEFVTSHDNKNTHTTKTVMDGFKCTVLEVFLADISKNDWVKISSNGFFRVHYPPSLMEQFLPAIRAKQLIPLDRIGVLDDLMAMVICGEASSSDLLRMLKAYVYENNSDVWLEVCNVIGKLNLLLEFSNFHEPFKEFGKSLLRRIYQKVGFGGMEEEKHMDEQLTSTILLKMLELGDIAVITEAKRRFTLHASTGTFIPPYLRAVVYRAVLLEGSFAHFECQCLVDIYRETCSIEEKARILRAFGCAKSDALINDIFGFILNDEIRAQDIPLVFFSMCSSRFGIEKAWEFFKCNISYFTERFPPGPTFNSLIKCLIENFASCEIIQEIEKFFYENRFEGVSLYVQQGVENVLLREAWLKRDYCEIEEFLTNETTNLIVLD